MLALLPMAGYVLMFSQLLCAATDMAVSITPARAAFCAFQDELYPPHYVTYRAEPGAITVDGKLDEAAWGEVAWTRPNRDICGPSPCSRGPARFATQQKIRWDDSFLYIAALLEEPQVWANNTGHDSVIFTDNDYEVFINPDGSTHNYKEFGACSTYMPSCMSAPPVSPLRISLLRAPRDERARRVVGPRHQRPVRERRPREQLAEGRRSMLLGRPWGQGRRQRAGLHDQRATDWAVLGLGGRGGLPPGGRQPEQLKRVVATERGDLLADKLLES